MWRCILISLLGDVISSCSWEYCRSIKYSTFFRFFSMITCRRFGVKASLSLLYLQPQPSLSFFLPQLRFFSLSSPLSVKKRMPPKKAQQEKKAVLGRPSNNLKIGIVGWFISPSLSTLFSSNSSALNRTSKRRKVFLLQRLVQHR